MSRSPLAKLSRQSDATAVVFAALGDGTRLSLVLALSRGNRQSIAQLSESKPLTRQATSKHLRILESAGVVRSRCEGRENLFRAESCRARRAAQLRRAGLRTMGCLAGTAEGVGGKVTAPRMPLTPFA
ncbi:ArsR family transcriptional regulator [Rhodanobacter sp. B04]|uniref:ArsR/SmtB family transcription factor n=1 Tax=Rhodanobacter sp. B04 TaxID=1945860 RepID=UPI0020C55824|nr:ArsR family transcriptional regulator [Rhodanobacter sp. B04]